MFQPVTSLDYENANTNLDIAEAILKRLEREQQIVGGTITRWHWDTPCVTLVWSADDVERNVTIVLVSLEPTFNIEGAAWVDNHQLKIRRWAYLSHPTVLMTDTLEQKVQELFERVKNQTDSDLTKLAKLS